MIDALDEAQGIQTPKLATEQRQEKLFKKLELSGLGSWPPELADSAHLLLAEYHNIFSLEPCELGCTYSTEHVIKVTDDAPFKEQFRQIPPPLVEEVCAYLQEMLDSGAIHPSQSAWCNGVVLVWMKEGSLCFCIDFCCLNACTKKDSSPLPRIHEALKSLVGAGHFSCLDLVWILADQDGWAVEAVHCIYSWNPRFLSGHPHAFWAVQHASHILDVNAELPHGAESNILPHLPWQYNHFLTDGWRTCPSLMHHLWLI